MREKIIIKPIYGVVITNSFFTPQAIQLASEIGVVLWDRNRLRELLKMGI
ncbi:MAG: restriction endonuclease [Clostridia bacterium]|nr:restriction endonuclease [Clostridia bacterium]